MSRETIPVREQRRAGERKSRPRALYVLTAALALQGLSGVGGGLGLIYDPTGERIGLPLEWLKGSAFSDYLLPGIVLLVVLGIGPLMLAYRVWGRRAGSWAGSLVVGLALFTWLGVEIAVVGYQADPPLQLIYGIVGTVILAATLHPSVRAHLTDARIDQ